MAVRGLRIWSIGRPLLIPATPDQLEAKKQVLAQTLPQQVVEDYAKAVKDIWAAGVGAVIEE